MDSTRIDLGRPRVVVSSVMSADGRLTLSGDQLLLHEETNRVWRSLQPPSARTVEDARSALLDRLYQPQAVLEGSGTFVTDDTGPVAGLPAADPAEDLHRDFLPDEVVRDPDNKWFAIVDGRGRVRWSMKSGGGYHLLILVAKATPADYLAFLREERIPYLVVGEEHVDLATALRRMAAMLGVTCVSRRPAADLTARCSATDSSTSCRSSCSPLVGGKGTPAMFDGRELAAGELPTSLRLLSFTPKPTDCSGCATRLSAPTKYRFRSSRINAKGVTRASVLGGQSNGARPSAGE